MKLLTIRGALKAAERCGGQVMVDMLQVSNLSHVTRMLLDMGCHAILLHTAAESGWRWLRS